MVLALLHDWFEGFLFHKNVHTSQGPVIPKFIYFRCSAALFFVTFRCTLVQKKSAKNAPTVRVEAAKILSSAALIRQKLLMHLCHGIKNWAS